MCFVEKITPICGCCSSPFLWVLSPIATYLESLQPKPALLPANTMQAAKVMELVCHLKLDVELVARRLLPEVLFKQPVSEETKATVKTDLAKGMKAVDRLFVGTPYAAGDQVTLADFSTF